MFYLRLNKVRILNNRELLGRAELQLMSLVQTDQSHFPILEEFFSTADYGQRMQLIGQVLQQIANSRVLTPIYKVRDRQELTFGDTGYVVFQSETFPEQLHWMLTAVELDGPTRDLGAFVKKHLGEGKLGSLVNAVASLAGHANPVSAAALLLSQSLMDAVVDMMQNDRDDQVGYFLTSMNRPEHYPHGLRDKQDVRDLTGNMFVDYSIFGIEPPVK